MKPRLIRAAKEARLTPREFQVLRLIMEMKINKEVASDLGVSVRAAKYHTSRILAKMRFANRIELWRAFLAAVLALASGAMAPGQTPAIVHSFTAPYSRGGSGTAFYVTGGFPEAVLSGNMVVCWGTFSNSGSATASFTDDKSNSGTVAVTTRDTTSSQSATTGYFLNVTNGPRTPQLKLSGATPNYDDNFCFEWMNVATSSAVDGTPHGAFGNSTAPASGSVTTTVNGDLVCSVLWDDGTQPMTSLTAPTGFTLYAQDWDDGYAVGCEIQGTAGAINPTWTMGPSTNWISQTIAFKAASAGTAIGAGVHIVSIHHYDICGSNAIFSVCSAKTTPVTIRTSTTTCPQSTCLEVASVNTAPTGYDISSMSSSLSNTWAKRGSICGSAGPGDSYFFSADNATTGATDTLTLTMTSGTSGGSPFNLYVITGAGNPAYDSTAGTPCLTGSNSTAGANISGVSITPSTSNGVVLSNGGENNSTATGLTTAGGVFDALTYTGESCSGPDPESENNPAGHVYNSNTSTIQFVWTTSSCSATNAWVNVAAAFKSAAAAAAANMPPAVY